MKLLALLPLFKDIQLWIPSGFLTTHLKYSHEYRCVCRRRKIHFNLADNHS